MKLFDFLKFAWQSGNMKRALKAVEKLTDNGKLARVVEEADNKDVRIAAVKKITDEVILKELVTKGIGYWNKQKLMYVYEVAREKLCEKLCEKVEKLTDQNLLVDIAKNNEYSGVCIVAVEKLTDQSVLGDIAKHGRHSDVREAAVEKLTDLTIFADIAKNSEYSDVRRAAVEKITDKEILKDVVLKDSNVDVLIAAIKKITDKDVLNEFALRYHKTLQCYENERRWEEKNMWITILKVLAPVIDPDIVKKIAEDDFRALAYVTDQAFLAEKVRRNYASSIGSTAAEALTDEEIIADLAIELEGSTMVCVPLVKKLTNPALKEKVQKHKQETTAEKARKVEAALRSDNSRADGKRIKHIVCLLYDRHYTPPEKAQIQQTLLDAEANRGSIVTETSRITFDSFYDNSSLNDPFSVSMKLKEIFQNTYGTQSFTDKYAEKTIIRETLSNLFGVGGVCVRFCVLYE
jgi:hypothetical protein